MSNETIEQRTSRIKAMNNLNKLFFDHIKILSFATPLVFGFVFYRHGEVLEAIFWVILSNVGFNYLNNK